MPHSSPSLARHVQPSSDCADVCGTITRRSVIGLVCLFAAWSLASRPALLADQWSGSIELKLDVDASNYSRHETQTWTLTGQPPKQSGAMALYPAKWHYTGGGSKTISFQDPVQGPTQRRYDWSVDVTRNVEVAIHGRASDKKLVIHQWTATLRVPDAISATQSATIAGGIPAPSTSFRATADQWNFGWIEADPGSTDVSDSSTVSVGPLPVPMGLDGSSLPPANVTWHLTSGPAGTPSASPPAFTATVSAAPVLQTLSVATISQLSPAVTAPGAVNYRVIITGNGTHFAPGTSRADFGDGITVTSLTVSSATSATAYITTTSSTPIGPRTVSVTTGPEIAKLGNGFSVIQGTVVGPPPPASGGVPQPSGPTITAITPATVAPGATHVAVTVRAANTGWTPGFTTADFGPGITITAVDVKSTIDAVVTLDVSAAAATGKRTVTFSTRPVGTGPTEQVSLANTFAVQLPQHYRVILNGFKVIHQTFHDIISPNGSGDEIYAAAGVIVATRNAPDAGNALTVLNSSVITTQVHGIAPDASQVTGSSFGGSSGDNRPRVRAGSATTSGGLTNGDVFPAGQDPGSMTAEPVAGSFPLLLWEGTFTNGTDAILIVPSVWKVTTGDTCVYDGWVKNWADGSYDNQRQAGLVRDRIQNGDLSPIPGPDCFPCINTSQLVGSGDPDNGGLLGPCACTPRRDRPIGIVPADPSYAPGMTYYHGTAVVVTQDAIERALNRPRQLGVLPPGVSILHFADDAGSEFAGNYDFYLRVERVAEIEASAPPNVTTAQTPSGQTAHVPVGVKTTTGVASQLPGQSIASKLVPAITAVTPNSGPQWSDALVVTFDAKNTAFAQGTTTVDLGPGITPVAVAPYQAVDVASPTKVLATLKIAGDATPGPRTITITTGNQVVRLANGFTVAARDVSEVFQVSPNSGQQGQQGLAVTISRPTGYWSSYFYLGTKLNFGPNIDVTAVEVQNGASVKATLNLHPNAPAGPCTVTVSRPGFADEFFPGAFTVTPGSTGPSFSRPAAAATAAAPVATLDSVIPNTVLSGRTASLVVRGKNTHFVDGTTSFAFGGNGTAVTSSHVTSPTSADVYLAIQPGVSGSRTAWATTGAENLQLASALTIINPIPLTLNPNTAVQGATVRVNLTAPAAHFAQGKTILSGLSTGTGWAVTSPTTAYIDLRIPASQPAGVFTCTLTTDNEVAEALNGFTITPAPDPWGKSCASATGIGTLSPGTSATRPGTIHAQGVRDWFAVSLPYATSLSLAVQPDFSKPGSGNSDFELVIYRDNCSTAPFASTFTGGAANDPRMVTVSNKTVTIANNAFEGPATTWFLLVCVQANQWSLGQPSFVLNLSAKATPPPAPVTTPYPFSFSDKRLALPGVDYYSETVTIQGINVPVSISINDKGYYSLNGGSYTSAPGTVYAGDKVTLRARLDALDISRVVTLTVGGQSANWWLTVKP
ncbi:MAG TPA: hypothetical protein VLT83_12085 [Opitutaceae bacterium]|nr:hypothetical protein [Opitutaceae bacterium]